MREEREEITKENEKGDKGNGRGKGRERRTTKTQRTKDDGRREPNEGGR